MIDAYQKQIELQNIGHDEFWLDTLTQSKLSRLWYEEIGEQNMLDAINEHGEDEGDCGHRIWLHDLDNMCLIDGCTDIMSVVASKRTDGTPCVSIQVNSPDDKKTVWADIDEFTPEVADLIYDQVMNYGKNPKPEKSERVTKSVAQRILDGYFTQGNCCFDYLATEVVPQGMTFEQAFELYIKMMIIIEGDRFVHIRDKNDICEYELKDNQIVETQKHIGLV